jgi:hypothetical protein
MSVMSVPWHDVQPLLAEETVWRDEYVACVVPL